MDLKSALLVAGIVSIVLMPTAFGSTVQIYAKDTSTGLTIDSSRPFQTCPAPITPQYIAVSVKNMGSSSDTYRLSFKSLPAQWTGTIQPEIPLAAGEEGRLDLFLVNMPPPYSLQPGTYDIVLEAESMSSQNDFAEVSIPVQILPCYSVSVQPVNSSADICEETGGSRTFEIEIINNGRYSDNYVFSTSSPWAALSRGSIALDRGQSGLVTVTLTPPAGLTGIQTVNVTASSSISYARAGGSINLNVRNCYDFNVTLRPLERTACFGSEAIYELEIANRGESDQYTIEVPAAISVDNMVLEIPAGGRQSTPVKASPSAATPQAFEIAVKSKYDPDLTRTVSGSLTGRECRGISVVISPSEKTACRGDAVDYSVTVRNTGTQEENFSLSANYGTLGSNSVHLTGGESKIVSLAVIPQEAAEDTVTVTASAPGISGSGSATLTSENCHQASLTIDPVQADICPCMTVDYHIVLENKGRVSDSYLFSYLNSSGNVSLQPGGKKEVSFPIQISCGETGTKTINATAYSAKTSVETASSINIKPLSQCFGAELTDGRPAQVDVYQGVAIPVKIRNTGESNQSFRLSVEGPDWVYVSPEEISLESGQEGSLYLYASPPVGTDEGRYTVKIIASSQYATQEHEAVIIVGQAGVTGSPVSLNVTFENLTGQFLNRPGGLSLRTLAIGIITVAIIVILIIRFAVLVGK